MWRVVPYGMEVEGSCSAWAGPWGFAGVVALVDGNVCHVNVHAHMNMGQHLQHVGNAGWGEHAGGGSWFRVDLAWPLACVTHPPRRMG
jgi:hypothetical protein